MKQERHKTCCGSDTCVSALLKNRLSEMSAPCSLRGSHAAGPAALTRARAGSPSEVSSQLPTMPSHTRRNGPIASHKFWTAAPAGPSSPAVRLRVGPLLHGRSGPDHRYPPKTASAVKAQYSTATGSTTSPPNCDTTTAGTDNPLSTRRPHARRKFSASSPAPDRPDPPPARTDSLQKRSFDHDGWPALRCQRPRVLSRDAR
jgi:hypothetical protein